MHNSRERKTPPSRKGKRILFLLPPRDFQDQEYQTPRSLCDKSGADVPVASLSLSPARGMLGGVVTPDVSIQDVSAADVDAVLLVGGTGASALWHNAAVHTLVKKLVQTGGVVGALCLAPVTLPNAGLLEGRAATAFPSAGDFLAWRGATYTGKAVEQSDTIITANGPDAAEELARLIARALAREGLSCPGRSRRTGESSLRSND